MTYRPPLARAAQKIPAVSFISPQLKRWIEIAKMSIGPWRDPSCVFSPFYREKFSREMGVGKDDHVVLERKSFIDFELRDSGKGEADEEDTSLTEKKQIIDAIGSKDTRTHLWGKVAK